MLGRFPGQNTQTPGTTRAGRCSRSTQDRRWRPPVHVDVGMPSLSLDRHDSPTVPPAVGRFFPAAPKLGRRSKCRVMETVAALGCMSCYLQPPSAGHFFWQLTERPRVSVFHQQVGAALAFFTTTPTARSLSLGARIRSKPGTPRPPRRGVFRVVGRARPLTRPSAVFRLCGERRGLIRFCLICYGEMFPSCHFSLQTIYRFR